MIIECYKSEFVLILVTFLVRSENVLYRFLIVLFLCIPSQMVHGKCICGFDTLSEDSAKIFDKYVILQAKVIDISSVYGLNWEYDLALLKVEAYWKKGGGPITKYINMYSDYGGTCSYYFEKGESYLVYAYKGENISSTSICTPTKPLTWALNDLKILGRGERPVGVQKPPRGVVLASTNSPVSSPWILRNLMGFLLIMGAMVVVIVLIRFCNPFSGNSWI